jgi:hypothetical protein
MLRIAELSRVLEELRLGAGSFLSPAGGFDYKAVSICDSPRSLDRQPNARFPFFAESDPVQQRSTPNDVGMKDGAKRSTCGGGDLLPSAAFHAGMIARGADGQPRAQRHPGFPAGRRSGHA